MRTYHANIAGADRPIHLWERPEDTAPLMAMIDGARTVGVDVEATGLDPYVPEYEIRLVQFGTKEQSWVVPFRSGTRSLIIKALESCRTMAFHNAAYDLKALDAKGLLDLRSSWARTVDTRILAHLLDPRGKHEGGSGMVLEDVCSRYFDHEAVALKADLMAHFKEQGWNKDTGWARVSTQNPVYIRYAGADVILDSWLLDAMGPLVKSRGFTELSNFEHEVARLCSEMERRGMLVDRQYGEELVLHYATEEKRAKRTAAEFGIEKLGSPKVVPEVLTALGANLVEQTPTGKPKVDKAVLTALIEHNPGTPLATVAEAILVGKNAGKWSKSYVTSTLDRLDAAGRVHPQIRALEARTARMSVAGPPLQQLPSGDWRVRRMFLADPGHSVFAVDYAQVELRVLAALANEKTMLAAIANGQDLHDTTARLLFGDDFTKAQRRLSKNTNFGEVYGGGAAVLARQAGVELEVAQSVKKRFRRAYPAIGRYAYNLRERAEFGKAAVVTPSGRELPLDRDRLYSATNYVVQSTARDVLCQALLDLDAAGLSEHLLLPVHDEVVGQAPVEDVEEVTRSVAEVMSMDFMDKVHLQAEGEVYGPSWGHGYGAPEMAG